MDTTRVEPRLVSVAQAASSLGLSRSVLFNQIRDGFIDSVKVGSRRLIPVAALDAFVRRLQADDAAE